jgi:hypothetical protein
VLCLAAFLPLTTFGDTVTNCTVQALVSALHVDGTATFDEDCSISLTNTIIVTGDLTIDGTGQTVTLSGSSSTQSFRLFYVKANASLTLTTLMLSGGKTNLGGAIYVEPGGALTVDDCTFTGNSAIGTNGVAGTNGPNSSGTAGNGTSGKNGLPAFGGAIFNLGDLTLSNCRFLSNVATGGDGGTGGSGGTGGYQGGNGASGGNGALAEGGAIFDGGPASSITDCTFDGNTVSGGNAGEGGAAGGGPFTGLKGAGGIGAPAYGGGIISTGFCTIERCTFSSNTAQGGNSTSAASLANGFGGNGAKGGDVFGGGACVLGASDLNQLVNCTFSGNQARAGNGGDGGPGTYTGGNGGNGGNANGGGLYNAGQVSIENCTFANCGATGGTNGVSGSGPFPGSDGAAGGNRGGGFANGGGGSSLMNSLLATNSPGGNLKKIAGTLTDDGYNLSSDASLTLNATGSHIRSQVNIGSLGDNGGLTQTIPLLPGSAAIDKIPSNFPDTDQRGIPRPIGAQADIGAFEVGPAFLTLPENQISTIGGDATFSAEALSADATFQWQLNHTNLPGATDSSLTVTNLTAELRGPYQVILTDSFGSLTSSPVFVEFAPVILSPPASATVTAGSNATFTVVAAGDTNLVFRWFFGTNLLTVVTNSGSPITNSSSYTVPQAGTNNVGTYTVSISNHFGKVTSPPVTLSVGVAPSIQSPPASQTNNAGSSVTFSVTASGTPTPGYQWSFNGTDLGGQNGSSFTLNNVQPTNQGTYTVVVSNSVGTNTASATLTVISPSAPSVVSGPMSQTVMTGGTASFSVTVSGTSPFTYQWRWNGSTLSGAVGPSFSISDVQPEDAGNYDVIVGNSIGSTRSPRAILTVVTQANRPTLTATKSNFSFNSVGGASYVVEYNTNLASSIWRPLSTNAGTGGQMTIPDSVNFSNRFYRLRVQ